MSAIHGRRQLPHIAPLKWRVALREHYARVKWHTARKVLTYAYLHTCMYMPDTYSVHTHVYPCSIFVKRVWLVSLSSSLVPEWFNCPSLIELPSLTCARSMGPQWDTSLWTK